MIIKQLVAVAGSLVALNAAAPAGPASDHNARVAEYLLVHQRDVGQHNARVSEHLLLEHLGARYHPNACVAEYLLLQHRNPAD
jgi:hypothetical protein